MKSEKIVIQIHIASSTCENKQLHIFLFTDGRYYQILEWGLDVSDMSSRIHGRLGIQSHI
jgi:hypothetical protein